MDRVVASDVGTRETVRLIGSDKVEGCAVRRSNGDKLGKIKRVMIEKSDGKVAYAVMSFGGFLGMGEDFYAIPWNLLRYNEALEGYELNLTDDQLRGAPTYDQNESDSFLNQAWEQRVHDYYGVPPYWL